MGSRLRIERRRIERRKKQDVMRKISQSQINEKRSKIERRVFAFLPPTLHVADDWRSRGLAIGDTIINLVTGLGGTPK